MIEDENPIVSGIYLKEPWPAKIGNFHLRPYHPEPNLV